jgi:Uma2 family endonuclease
VATVSKAAGPLALRGVTYDEYVRIRDHPGNGHTRLVYHNGVLEIMSPEFRHEVGSQRLGALVRAVAAVFAIPYIAAGTTTFRRGGAGVRRGHGKEPDQSFYFAHAAAVWGKETIDLEMIPPPDLWIEVDNRASSRGRLPLYAALGVPEVWCYRARRGTLWFGRLEGGAYVPIDRSLSLPMLTPAIVLDLLGRVAAAGDEAAWDNQMRAWLANVLRPQYEQRP